MSSTLHCLVQYFTRCALFCSMHTEISSTVHSIRAIYCRKYKSTMLFQTQRRFCKRVCALLDWPIHKLLTDPHQIKLQKFMRSWNLEETFALIKDLLAGEAQFSQAAVPRSCWLSCLIPACLLKLMKLKAGIANETDSPSHGGLRQKINKRPNNLKRSREKDRERRCFFPGLRSVCLCQSVSCVLLLPPAPPSRHSSLLW